MTKRDVLKKYFGHDFFRPGQEEIVDNLLSGRDVLGVMPTGAGKSVCYQVPAMLMDGITIVVSPLISLMKDQVRALAEAGVPCAYINSSLHYLELREVYHNARNGAYKIIYVAPERLGTDEFMSLAESVKISMVTVDEAHCVSQWGQDFRPGYLKIVDFIQALSYRPVVGAFTATATKSVRRDVAEILRLNNPFVIVTGFDRKNLYFEVKRPKAKDKFNELVYFLSRPNMAGKSGIVYAISRKGVESLCDELCKRGFSATGYHAGLEPEERQKNQDDFLFDRKTVMVATNAFGMGIDKSNVSFVVHYNMPKNLESYYQEAGRAGRDGEPADCILLYTPGDVRTNKFMIENSEENTELSEEMRERIRERDLERLKQMTFYCTTDDCLRGFILKYFGESAEMNCGHCSNCNTNFEMVDITEDAQKIISCVMRIVKRRQSYGKNMIADVLAGSKSEKVLNRHLDNLSTYGILGNYTKPKIVRIIEYLIKCGYLMIDEDNYNVVLPCRKANKILFNGERLSMRLPKERLTREKKSIASAETDEVLFARLKELRKQLAIKQSVPAYVIFSDASLRDMCEKLPETMEEFSDVSGVGAAKLSQYGKLFVDLINEYKSQ